VCPDLPEGPLLDIKRPFLNGSLTSELLRSDAKRRRFPSPTRTNASVNPRRESQEAKSVPRVLLTPRLLLTNARRCGWRTSVRLTSDWSSSWPGGTPSRRSTSAPRMSSLVCLCSSSLGCSCSSWRYCHLTRGCWKRTSRRTSDDGQQLPRRPHRQQRPPLQARQERLPAWRPEPFPS
jgi:hypothetical protein